MDYSECFNNSCRAYIKDIDLVQWCLVRFVRVTYLELWSRDNDVKWDLVPDIVFLCFWFWVLVAMLIWKFQICPEMQVNEMHALYDKHYKVSSFLNIILSNMK